MASAGSRTASWDWGGDPQPKQMPALPGVDPDQQGLSVAVGGQVLSRHWVVSGQAAAGGGSRFHRRIVLGGQTVVINQGRNAPAQVGGQRGSDEGLHPVAAVLPPCAVVSKKAYSTSSNTRGAES